MEEKEFERRVLDKAQKVIEYALDICETPIDAVFACMTASCVLHHVLTEENPTRPVLERALLSYAEGLFQRLEEELFAEFADFVKKVKF